MRLEPLYRARFSTSQSWSVDPTGPGGTESQNFLLTDGRCDGPIAGSWRGANYPRRRADGTLTPDFRGVLETDDGATIIFAWHGYGHAAAAGASRLVGSMTHITDDERYRWLNDTFCAVAGGVQRRTEGAKGLDVVLDVSQLVWEPLTD
jgi:hypothetical protein